MKAAYSIIIPLILLSCKKDQTPLCTVTDNTALDVEYINSTTGPISIDLNDDGVEDVTFAGSGLLNASFNFLFLRIEGINGASVCYQVKNDTTWSVDIMTGDTTWSYNTYKEAMPFEIGEVATLNMNFSSEQIKMFEYNYSGPSGYSSGINRMDLWCHNPEDYHYFTILCDDGLHWIKIRTHRDMYIYSHSIIGATSELRIGQCY